MSTQKVAFLGPEASFTHLASKALFQDETLVPIRTIPECIEAVSRGKVDIAVVPVENALEGIVPLTIDYLFHEADVYVIAEIQAPIEQHLMVHPNNKEKWEEITTIYSHPHALAQCHKYLYYRFGKFHWNNRLRQRQQLNMCLKMSMHALQLLEMHLLQLNMD